MNSKNNVGDGGGTFPWMVYEIQLAKIKQLPQTSAVLSKQLAILIPFAEKLGLHDAAEYLKNQ